MRGNPPEYPPEEMSEGISGVVVLFVTVNADGEPIDVKVDQSSNNRKLDRAAIEAARRWRFNPGTRNSAKIGGVVRIPVEFN